MESLRTESREIVSFAGVTERESLMMVAESFCKLAFTDCALHQAEKKKNSIKNIFLTKGANLSDEMTSLKNSLQNQNELLIAEDSIQNHFFYRWPRQD